MGHNMLAPEAKTELKIIFNEVAAVFDKAPYIHIGGDEISFDDNFLVEMIDHVHSLGKKVIIWNKYNSPAQAIDLNTVRPDMCTNWATSDTITEGIPNIDIRYNYTNHFDVFADVVGIFKSSIFYEPRDNDNVGGTISTAWNDTMTLSGADTIPTSFTIDEHTYNSSLMTGAGIYLRHIWHGIVKGNYDNPQPGNTAYAWTEIYSPEDQEAAALIEFYTYSRSGNEKGPLTGLWDRRGSRIWINGKELAAPEWQQPDTDILQDHNHSGLSNENFTARPATPVHLHKGWNRVFLKLPYADNGGTKRNKWQFTFVITDKDGHDALDGLIYSPSKNLD